MGFAPVAASTILFIAAMHVAGTAVPQWLEAQDALDRARDASHERALESLDMDAAFAARNATSGNVTFQNTGEVTVRIPFLVVLVDGAPSNATVTSSGNSSLWLPGASITVVAGPAADHVALVLPTGRMVLGGS